MDVDAGAFGIEHGGPVAVRVEQTHNDLGARQSQELDINASSASCLGVGFTLPERERALITRRVETGQYPLYFQHLSGSDARIYPDRREDCRRLGSQAGAVDLLLASEVVGRGYHNVGQAHKMYPLFLGQFQEVIVEADGLA